MKKSKLQGIGIGAGYFSHFQYEAWNRIDDVEIVAIVNRDVSKAEDLKQKYNIPNAYSLDELEHVVEKHKPDFVDIITSPTTHDDLCRFFASKGIPMVCQKPFCTDMDIAKKLVRDVENTGTPLMVHENWRWQPWYRKIKSLLDDGTIGELFNISVLMRMGDGWGDDAYLGRQPFFRDYERLLVFETGVHFLDTFRYIGGEITSVFASLRKRNHVIKGEDAGIIHCTFATGATATLDASRYNEAEHSNPRYTFGEVRVDGEKGHLRMNMDGEIYLKQLGEQVQKLNFEPPSDGFAGDCVLAIQKHFVDCLRMQKPFESTGRDYLKTLELVEACYASNANKQVERISRGGGDTHE